MEKQIKDRKCFIYDIETLKSCFTYSALNIDTKEIVQFVIHKDKCEYYPLVEHLKKCRGHIGFNNLNFDYPIIHKILINLWDLHKPEEIITEIYKEAQRIIETQNSKNFNQTVAIKQSEVIIPQLDLFKIWHFNNAARATSLKALEVSLNLENVMEMPIPHTKEDISLEELKMILEYNLNDVEATYQFYLKSLDKIQLRKDLMSIYQIPMLNFNDVKIGESIFLKLLSEDMNIPAYELRKYRTFRDVINLSDIILPYITFKNSKLNNLLQEFKNTIVVNTKNGFKKSVILDNNMYEYGQGGIHMCTKSGVYNSDEEWQIYDLDVASFYPNLAVNNKFRPEHLGESFSKIYGNIYSERSKIPKSDPRNGAYKLMLNGCFGKAGDENSFLFDNKFLLSITVNGQLLISMLIDELLLNPNIKFLQANTDGITIMYKRNKDEDFIKNVCVKWEELTKLKLEYVEYSKMVIRDVNSYLAITNSGKIKYKGAFEVDKEYHKDNSFRIIPLALSEYFTKGIPIEKTIRNHTNIFDFYGRQKFKSDSYGIIQSIVKDDKGVPINHIEKQHKITRYYISNKGGVFIKNYTKGTSEIINKGYLVTTSNKHIVKNIEEYDINYNFYISEAKKELNNIETKQLELF